MTRARVDFGRQAYESRSKPFSLQSCVNLFPQLLTDGTGKSQLVLHGTPGLAAFSTPGSGPIRGVIKGNTVLWVVSGGGVYTVGSGGVATLIGTIPFDTTPVTMAFNGTQVCIVTDANIGYIATTTGVSVITDADLPAPTSVAYMDGYGIFTTSNGRFFVSSLNDFSSVDALDFASAESNPDGLLRALVDHRELWLFGERTIEVWYNAGAADFPFVRNDAGVIERGCAAKHSPAKVDNSVFWLGDDGVVYRAQGYQPIRISTHGIEKAIGDMTAISDAIGMTWTLEGHKVYCLTFPTGGQTFAYDVASGLWHQLTSSAGRWRGMCAVEAFSKVFIGDRADGRLHQLDLDTYTEQGTAILREVTAPAIEADGRRFRVRSLQIDVETGVGITAGQGSDPQAMLQWSDDGGRTFSPELWTTMGAIGDYRVRAIWRRLGQSRSRNFRLRISDPVKIAIIAAYVEIEADAA